MRLPGTRGPRRAVLTVASIATFAALAPAVSQAKKDTWVIDSIKGSWHWHADYVAPTEKCGAGASGGRLLSVDRSETFTGLHAKSHGAVAKYAPAFAVPVTVNQPQVMYFERRGHESTTFRAYTEDEYGENCTSEDKTCTRDETVKTREHPVTVRMRGFHEPYRGKLDVVALLGFGETQWRACEPPDLRFGTIPVDNSWPPDRSSKFTNVALIRTVRPTAFTRPRLSLRVQRTLHFGNSAYSAAFTYEATVVLRKHVIDEVCKEVHGPSPFTCTFP